MSYSSLGGGKVTVNLLDMVPEACIDDVGKLLDEYDLDK